MKVTANYSKKTFTIRKNGLKYRTLFMSTEEFNEELRNTENDWKQFLKTSDAYYKVQK